MAMLENFASLEEKILCLNYPISKLDGVYFPSSQKSSSNPSVFSQPFFSTLSEKVVIYLTIYFRLSILQAFHFFIIVNRIKFQKEYGINSSPSMLYNYLSTPSGLGEWFASNVNSRSDIFLFSWNQSEENATLIKKKREEFVRFQWEEDKGTNYYFEMKIEVDELTKDVALIVTDFAKEDEIEESKMYWDNLISELKQIMGS